MLRILLICLAFFAVVAGPSGAFRRSIFEDFDPAPLSLTERRLLQTALALPGDYRGPLDGAGGPRPARRRSRPTAGASRRPGAERPRRRAGPRPRRGGPPQRLGLPLPPRSRHLARPAPRPPRAPEPEEGGERRWSEDARLTVLTHRFDAEEARRWHGAALKANADPGALVTGRRTDRLVTAGVLRDGRGFYTRSDRAGAHWATVLLVGEPDQAGALNLAAAASGPASPSPGTCPRTAASSGS